jgi:predicted nucleic acid-binding protein
MMSLDIPAGEPCFVDANILIYHLTNIPPWTQLVEPFLLRVITGEITGFTSSIVLSEVLHKLMLAEVRALFPQAVNPLRYTQKHPHIISQLLVFPHAVAKLANFGLTLLPVTQPDWARAADLAVAHSLFTNDACVVALMRRHDIKHLATNDKDFQGIPEIIAHGLQ